MSTYEPVTPQHPLELHPLEHIGNGIWTYRYEDHIYHFEEKIQRDYFSKGFKTAIYMIMETKED